MVLKCVIGEKDSLAEGLSSGDVSGTFERMALPLPVDVDANVLRWLIDRLSASHQCSLGSIPR